MMFALKDDVTMFALKDDVTMFALKDVRLER
jgi:hypothetical protein